MIRLSASIAALWLIITMMALAQPVAKHRVAGSVVDAKSGEPIVGATVRVYSTSTADSLVATSLGAISGVGGLFEVRLPPDSSFVLETTFIGYSPVRVTIGPTDHSVSVELVERAVLSQQVQVNAARRTRSVEDACCRVESIREEVQQHAPFSPSAVDVLRRYSSCTSTRTLCALDNSQTIRLRGLEPTYIAVLFDGMPAISGLGTMYGLGILPAHALQTIRIAEGASSGLYGNGAISGVVDLQTRQPTEVSELTVTGNVGDHRIALPGERDLNVSYTGLLGDVGIAAFASANMHDRQDGIVPSIYERISGLVKGNMLIGGATDVTVATLVGREMREGRVGGAIEAAESVRTTRGDVSLTAAHTFEDDSELQVRGLLSHTGVDGDYIGNALDASQLIGYANVTHLRYVGDHALTVGVEVRDDRLSVHDGAPIGYEMTVASAFMQDELPLGDLFAVMGSARVDHHSATGTIVSPRGSLKFEPVANMTMRLMAGTGFKGQAHFDEQPHRALHGEVRWASNPMLQFERSFTLNYDVSYSFVVGDKFGVDANFNTYHTTIDGKVVPHPDSLSSAVLFMTNSDQPTRLTGLELQLRPSFGDHWSGSIALSLIRYEMRSAGGTYERIPLAPSFNLDASLMYRNVDVGVTGELWGSHVGSQRLSPNPFSISESSPYTLVNARFEKSFGDLALYVGVNNALRELQTATMPLVYTGETGITSEAIWGPTEDREFFLGFRWSLLGAN